jgi:ribokinase
MPVKLTDTTPSYTLPRSVASRPIDIIALGSLVMERIIQVERWPETGGQDVVPVKSITDTSGGCAMNVACFTSRQGGKAAIISRIGDGIYSRITWEELAISGVSTKYLTCSKGKEGSLIIILSNPAGDWAVLDYIDPELSLKIEDLPQVNEFMQSKFVHIDGFSFLSVGEKEPVQEAVIRARQAGCILSVDASVPAAKTERNFLEALFRQADFGFANKYEALQITQALEIQSAVEVLQTMGPKVSVLKMGLEGSYVITPDAVGFVPAYEVDILDTVAAGDAYIATMLLSLCRGLPLMESATRGSAAGALACLGFGSLSSRFTDVEIDALIARGPKKPKTT